MTTEEVKKMLDDIENDIAEIEALDNGVISQINTLCDDQGTEFFASLLNERPKIWEYFANKEEMWHECEDEDETEWGE